MENENHSHHASYRRLAIMAGLSFVSMYILMYAMVDSIDNVFLHINQAYMAGLMTAPMVVFELMLMKMMYRNKKINAIVIGASILIGVLCYVFIRQQTWVDNEAFLRSMIPHHGGAVLMCQEASIEDARIQELCQEIIASQISEINEMKSLLSETAEAR